jgi:hypothetical protein
MAAAAPDTKTGTAGAPASAAANDDAKDETAAKSTKAGEGRKLPDPPVQLADEITVAGVEYDDDGHLVAAKGKNKGRRIALAADATDPDVGWTVQHGRGKDGVTKNQQPTTPDQTFHPDELPDPEAALRAGLLPQDVGSLNVDEDKFEDSKPLLV